MRSQIKVIFGHYDTNDHTRYYVNVLKFWSDKTVGEQGQEEQVEWETQ